MLLQKRDLKKGFTLVELLVTISIFVILTGIVIFNQGKFNSTILLTNLAYDTALTIRQAQTYGINIKGFDTGSGGIKAVPYGVHFETGDNNKSFILFADIADKNKFNGATLSACITDEGCVNRYNIQRGNYVSQIDVSKGDTISSVDKLDIIFQRPNPDALIYANGLMYDKATIYLTSSDKSNTKKVLVQANGLIEIVN